MGTPFLKVVRIPNPAVATEITFTPPGGEWWRLISVTFTLTTDATVSNRSVTLAADDGTSTFWRIGSNALQTSNTVAPHCAFAGTGIAQSTQGTLIHPLPFGGLWLEAGWRFRTDTDLIQAGDQYSDIVAVVQEFHTGPDALVAARVLGVPFAGG